MRGAIFLVILPWAFTLLLVDGSLSFSMILQTRSRRRPSPLPSSVAGAPRSLRYHAFLDIRGGSSSTARAMPKSDDRRAVRMRMHPRRNAEAAARLQSEHNHHDDNDEPDHEHRSFSHSSAAGVEEEVRMKRQSSSSSISSPNNESNDGVQGILYMALASLSFSLMFLGVKLYSSAPTFTLVFYRSVVQMILSGGLLLLRTKKEQDGNPLLGPKDADVRWLLTLRGTFGSLAVAAMFYAIQNLPLPDAITLQFTTPVFAAMMAVPLLGEPWKRSNMVGAAFCLSGVLLIARPSWLFGTAAAATASTTTTAIAAAAQTATATTVGLVGAAFAALAYVLVRRIGSRADANVMVFYYALISGLTAPLGAKLLASSGGGSGSGWDVVGSPTAVELLVFAGLGVFGFLGQLFTNLGLTKCDSAATATLVTNTQIVFAFLFEITILHESLSPWSIAGSALIVGYMAFAGISKISNEKKA